MGVPEERYSQITGKNRREICLLRGFPCAWGKCAFCDYIEDNGRDGAAMAALNRQVLQKVTGAFGVLEVINSGSCFELPQETLDDIRKLLTEKDIRRLFFEAHWMYRNRLEEMRRRMPAELVFKIGVETFDRDFRERVLNKHADFEGPEEVARYFDSPCLMVGIQGQTRDMIARDIDYLKKYFKLGTVNVYNNNTTPIRRDEELVRWFMEEYRWLLEDPAVEVLYEITDFGVG
ncbi:MAG TPA: radical SAM protein [Candidatus Ventrimonas merdavium]|nr:radical SAM protein [Candidatus Ventrimonas merdavium]